MADQQEQAHSAAELQISPDFRKGSQIKRNSLREYDKGVLRHIMTQGQIRLSPNRIFGTSQTFDSIDNHNLKNRTNRATQFRPIHQAFLTQNDELTVIEGAEKLPKAIYDTFEPAPVIRLKHARGARPTETLIETCDLCPQFDQ